jgi:hypothetical protein
MQRIHLTRDSVAAGDDIDAPHHHSISVPTSTSALSLVQSVLEQRYLPRIAGGKATWVISSHEPFAVCAQEWASPEVLTLPPAIEALDTEDGAMRLHFRTAQVDPALARRILSECKFQALKVR